MAGGNDFEVDKDFQPGREGRESDGLEERREELMRREKERLRKEEERRKKGKEQGARSKTKKSDGKTYIQLEDLGEEARRRRLERVVRDVKISGGRSVPADVGEAAQRRVTELLDGIFENVQHEKILVAISELDDKYLISSTDKGSNYYALNDDENFEDGKEHKKLSDALGARLSKRASDLDAKERQLKQKQTTPTPGGRVTGQKQTTPMPREDQGADQGADRGEDQGADQGADQGEDQGADRDEDQGADRGEDQGAEDQEADRGEDQGAEDQEADRGEDQEAEDQGAEEEQRQIEAQKESRPKGKE